MISKIEVWGDSILRGVVLDPATRRYSRLKEASCVALSSRALGIPAENHARFGMTSEKGRVVMEREIPAHAEGEAALIGFGGNDIDYDWRAVAADPHAEHLPHTPPKRFCENMRAMVCLARSRGMEPLLMTLPPIDAVRYYEWIGRDIEGKENILVWLGDVQQIYRSHAAYNRLVVELARQLGCRLVDLRASYGRHPSKRGGTCADGACFSKICTGKSSYGMNKMNSVWEKSGALFLLYSQKGNVIMFLGLRNAPMALKVGSVQDCGKSFAVPQQKNVPPGMNRTDGGIYCKQGSAFYAVYLFELRAAPAGSNRQYPKSQRLYGRGRSVLFERIRQYGLYA